MRIAVLSDIHANFAALQAVEKDLLSQEVEGIWCLGDVVGYGGEPQACLAWVQRFADVHLQGNHDYAVATGDTNLFNPVAAEAARIHRELLDANALAQLEKWTPIQRLTVEGTDVLVAHGSPDDPIWEYVPVVSAVAGLTRWSGLARIILIGHTHHPFAAQTPGEPWSTKHFLQSIIGGGAARPPLLLVNPGSVGQPRDGDSRASYAILDFSRKTVTLRRVEYDIGSARDAIEAVKIPSALGWRLEKGL